MTFWTPTPKIFSKHLFFTQIIHIFNIHQKLIIEDP